MFILAYLFGSSMSDAIFSLIDLLGANINEKIASFINEPNG